MENEILINKIYSNTINVVLNGVDDIYKKELSLAYFDYLKRTYINYSVNGSDADILSSIFSDLEISKWKDISISSKLTELLKDENLENIRYISNVGFKYARNRVNQREPSNPNMILPPVLSEETAEKNIAILQELLLKVRSFNINLAKTFVSEGILDFEFACGKTDNMSLRIGRLAR